MDIPWEDLRLLIAVAESKSVSAAARQLKLGQPTVSRRLAALEYALGEPLFVRSVAGVTPTPTAERLLVPARRMAEWAAEVERTAAGREPGPQGMVRVTAPPYIAFDFLAPFAASLRAEHSALQLEVLSSMQYLDLARGEADLALRGPGKDSPGLKVVAALEIEAAVFVARKLAAKLPKKKLRLTDVPWVAWAPPWEDLPPNPQLRAMDPAFVPAFTSDHFLVNLSAAEAGVGAIVLGKARHRFSRASELVPLDLDLGPFSRTSLRLMCAKSAYDVPRVRFVADALARELLHLDAGRQRPGLQRGRRRA